LAFRRDRGDGAIVGEVDPIAKRLGLVAALRERCLERFECGGITGEGVIDDTGEDANAVLAGHNVVV
jgi:hypothetical protein